MMLNNGPKHFKSSPDQRVAPLLRPVYPKLNKFCQANNASHSNAETGTHVYRYIIHTLSLSLLFHSSRSSGQSQILLWPHIEIP